MTEALGRSPAKSLGFLAFKLTPGLSRTLTTPSARIGQGCPLARTCAQIAQEPSCHLLRGGAVGNVQPALIDIRQQFTKCQQVGNAARPRLKFAGKCDF